MSKLTPDERRALIALGIFSERPDKPCPECGGYHLRQSSHEHPGSACPRVKRLTFMGNGNRTEVEYWASWDESNTIYPEDLYDDSPEDMDASTPD